MCWPAASAFPLSKCPVPSPPEGKVGLFCSSSLQALSWLSAQKTALQQSQQQHLFSTVQVHSVAEPGFIHQDKQGKVNTIHQDQGTYSPPELLAAQHLKSAGLNLSTKNQALFLTKWPVIKKILNSSSLCSQWLWGEPYHPHTNTQTERSR